jgi:UDP-2,3-diacylglucosamine pyrophosphatase LpxH
MQLVVKISKRTSLNTINDLIIWVRDKWGGELSFVNHALREPALLNNKARYVVYGHTHHQEIVSLDLAGHAPNLESQIYFNSGTWHSYYDLAIRNPSEQKFVPYQTMTYLVFYKPFEHGKRSFETWSGTFA